jgi:hypothetical protein
MDQDDPKRVALMALYRAFNDRDVDAALVHIAPGVDWQDESGGRIGGREALAAHWRAWWRQADPRIEPLDIEPGEGGTVVARVEQFVRTLDGKVLEDRDLAHVFTFEGPFVSRMDIAAAPADDDDEDEQEA